MMLFTLALVSFAHASSRLDWPVSVLKMKPTTATLFRAVLEANGLPFESTTLETVATMPRHAWKTSGMDLSERATHLREILRALAAQNLLVEMSEAERELFRKEPGHRIFRAVELSPVVRRTLHAHGVFLNQQLLNFVGTKEPQEAFRSSPPASREAIATYHDDLKDLLGALRPVARPHDYDFEFRTHARIRHMLVSEFISPRVHGALGDDGRFKTFGDLMDARPGELLRIKGLGPSAVDEIRANLAGHGVAMRGEEFRRLGMPAPLNERLAHGGIRTIKRLADLIEPWPQVVSERAAALYIIHERHGLDLDDDDLREILRVVARAKDEHRHRVLSCRSFLGAEA